MCEFVCERARAMVAGTTLTFRFLGLMGVAGITLQYHFLGPMVGGVGLVGAAAMNGFCPPGQCMVKFRFTYIQGVH